MDYEGFKRNLILLDSYMPQMVGIMLLYSCQEGVVESKKLVKLMRERNPLEYDDDKMYIYKFKKFLCSCVLGMKSTENWYGWDETGEGYMIGTDSWKTKVYYVFDKRFFEQYLLENTILEGGDSSKNDEMRLFEQNGEIFMRINLQMKIY